MGIYINKGNEEFRSALRGEYVDKSGLIAVVNNTLLSRQRFSCVTRSRRFGKSLAAMMLYAYYDHSCDSRQLFADLEIAHHPSFEEHLNKYPTIFIDMTDFLSRDMSVMDIVPTLEREVKADVRAAYPEAVVDPDDDLMAVLTKTALHYGEQFVFIIDEWDAICREALGNEAAMEKYVKLLRRLFKGGNSQCVFAAVYMTGILPIKKYKTESALNNFTEYSMVDPADMGRFFGFTRNEVQRLAEKYGMDFDELEKWYDGYQIGDELSMFNPNSVIQAVSRHRCRSYWSSTGSFDAVAGYINQNFDGLKDDIIEMLAGGREKVDPTRFQNDENSLSCVINIAYYSARNDYIMVREMPTGKVYADIVFLPRKNVSRPALVIELKKDRAAIMQIRECHYPQQVEQYTGDMLLVGINYDEDTKKHDCQIELWRKE